MKKLFGILLAWLLAVTLAACGAAPSTVETGSLSDDAVADAVVDEDITAREATGSFSMTTEDGVFTLSVVSCLGCCSLAPVMMIGERTYGALTPDKANQTAFATTMLNLLLDENEGKKRTLGCDTTDTKDGENHFWLLKRR